MGLLITLFVRVFNHELMGIVPHPLPAASTHRRPRVHQRAHHAENGAVHFQSKKCVGSLTVPLLGSVEAQGGRRQHDRGLGQ